MRKLIHIALASGLLLALMSGTALAQDDFEQGARSETFGQAAVFLPWVPNGTDDLEGIGPFYGNVSVQNIEQSDIEVDIYVGLGEEFIEDEDGELIPGDFARVHTVELSANESITLDADTLGIPRGQGASIMMTGWFDEFPIPSGTWDDFEDLFDEIDWPARISASTKNVNPQPGSSGMTSEDHVSVDGYTALDLDQIISEDGTWVLPIAQNNSGWETMIRVAHLGEYFDYGDSPATITLRFYGSGEQGYAGESWQEDVQLRPGGVTSVNLSDHVPEDFVGSVFIESSAEVGAIAERYKAETDMLVTNTSQPEQPPERPGMRLPNGSATDDDAHYAPLIFKDYNYWNTGISVANTDPERSNNVTVTYYGPTNNQVAQDTLTIPPRGMEFIYTPGSQDLGLGQGFVGSARIEGTTSLHAAVDQVKYFGDDEDVGQAMSYIAEDQIAGYYEIDSRIVRGGQELGTFISAVAEEFGVGDTLTLPLAQKGNPNTGNGDSSGVQLFNTSSSSSVQVALTLYGANGVPVAPTVDDNEANPILVTLSAGQSYTLYTQEQPEISSGFQGSVTAQVVGGDGGVTGVSNNVNYEVQNDGSAAFNMPTVFPFYQIFGEIIDIVCDEAGEDNRPEFCEAYEEGTQLE